MMTFWYGVCLAMNFVFGGEDPSCVPPVEWATVDTFSPGDRVPSSVATVEGRGISDTHVPKSVRLTFNCTVIVLLTNNRTYVTPQSPCQDLMIVHLPPSTLMQFTGQHLVTFDSSHNAFTTLFRIDTEKAF